MEGGGIFEERATFWREINPVASVNKDGKRDTEKKL
jgi:hypothetical protein